MDRWDQMQAESLAESCEEWGDFAGAEFFTDMAAGSLDSVSSDGTFLEEMEAAMIRDHFRDRINQRVSRLRKAAA